MKRWDLFTHPTQGTMAIKQGFSWPAFFFTYIWAYTKRLWTVVLGFLAAHFVSGGVLGVVAINDPQALARWSWILVLAANLVMGFKGNDFCRASIRKRGFAWLHTVEAPSRDAALADGLKEARSVL